MLHNIAFAHQPVINGDVPLQVKLTVMEFDNGETSAADHVDFMHAGDAAFQDHRQEVENLSWSGCGQVDIRQYRVLRPPIVWHAFPWLKKEGISPKASSLSSYMCDIVTKCAHRTCSVVDLAWAWNTLVCSRSKNRSRSHEWMPNVLTDEPNGRIWLSANHPTYGHKS